MQVPLSMGASAADVLERAHSGAVRSIFCADVDSARLEVRSAAEELEPMPTLVALEWLHAPALAAELEEIRDALGRAAASLWPDWYITAEQRFERHRSASSPVRDVIRDTSSSSPFARPSQSWLKEAWRCCAAGKLPVVRGLTAAEQVRQLSRALDPERLVFALSVASPLATPARVRSLSRAAEWLANESQAKILLLLPEAWRKHPELDHVTYQALSLDSDSATPVSKTSTGPESGSARGHGSPQLDGSLQVILGPIVGKPHPASQVEQLLHAHLTADSELGPLFEYNQCLKVHGEKRCTVDLIWRGGSLVIEVDGDEHCRPLAYHKDRDRDYRLFMSGYTVLRVTNADVTVDVEGVVAKIRSVVKRLQTSGFVR